MEERTIAKMMLAQYVRRLYVVTGKTNLYVSTLSEKSMLNKERLKKELETIKALAGSIEREIDNI